MIVAVVIVVIVVIAFILIIFIFIFILNFGLGLACSPALHCANNGVCMATVPVVIMPVVASMALSWADRCLQSRRSTPGPPPSRFPFSFPLSPPFFRQGL